ncbi:hypothetical protein [Arenimonas terrae]|jgi:hypothetical protein|uniref:hypothetical protein n=1 Tax=Arenimonas terrae TaxID=2546226 RepID=UPI00159EF406|nr:hypothetical protein [Arenimonas terrae]
MVLIVERRDAPSPTAIVDPGPRSLERALKHMHWHFLPGDASPLVQRRASFLSSSPTAQEAP